MLEQNQKEEKTVQISYSDLIDIAQNYRRLTEEQKALKTKYAKLEAELKRLKNNGNNGNSKSRIPEPNGDGKEYKTLNQYIQDQTVPAAERRRVFSRIMKKRYGFLWWYTCPELVEAYLKIGLEDFKGDRKENAEKTKG